MEPHKLAVGPAASRALMVRDMQGQRQKSHCSAPQGTRRGESCVWAANLVQLLELIEHNYRRAGVIPDQSPEIHQRGGERQLGDDDSLLLGVRLQNTGLCMCTTLPHSGREPFPQRERLPAALLAWRRHGPPSPAQSSSGFVSAAPSAHQPGLSSHGLCPAHAAALPAQAGLRRSRGPSPGSRASSHSQEPQGCSAWP